MDRIIESFLVTDEDERGTNAGVKVEVLVRGPHPLAMRVCEVDYVGNGNGRKDIKPHIVFLNRREAENSPQWANLLHAHN